MDNHDIEPLIKKANQGDPEAQFQLAVRYKCGQGVDKDYAEAAR